MRQLLTSALLAIASAPVAAGQTTVTGTTIDTQGFEDVTIKAKLGTITSTGVATLKAAHGDAANGSDKQDIEGSAVVATDADSNKYLAIEIHRPRHRYITPILTRETANVVVEGIEVILSGASHTPVAQPEIAADVALNGPDTGDA